MKPTLHVATAARAGIEGVTLTAVLRWDGAGSRRVIARRQRHGNVTAAAYRAIVLGLTEARRLRARTVIVYVDDPDVVAQLDGAGSPPPAVVGLYLQVRALLNAFRSAQVRYNAVPAGDGAVGAAGAAVDRGPVYTDLPLWAAAS